MCNDDRGVVAMINRYRIRPMTISGTRLTIYVQWWRDCAWQCATVIGSISMRLRICMRLWGDWSWLCVQRWQIEHRRCIRHLCWFFFFFLNWGQNWISAFGGKIDNLRMRDWFTSPLGNQSLIPYFRIGISLMISISILLLSCEINIVNDSNFIFLFPN